MNAEECTFDGCENLAVASDGDKHTCQTHSNSLWWHCCTEDHASHWDRRLPDGRFECPQRRNVEGGVHAHKCERCKDTGLYDACCRPQECSCRQYKHDSISDDSR